MEEIKQKSVESYFLEFNIPEDKKEKILAIITNLVYKMNQKIVKLEKEQDETERLGLIKVISENDSLIRNSIKEILDGKIDQINYDY